MSFDEAPALGEATLAQWDNLARRLVRRACVVESGMLWQTNELAERSRRIPRVPGLPPFMDPKVWTEGNLKAQIEEGASPILPELTATDRERIRAAEEKRNRRGARKASSHIDRLKASLGIA